VVVNDTDPVPPDAGTLAEVGFIVSTAPDCVTVNVSLGPREGFTVIVAVREAVCGFGAAVKEKLPLPVPVPDEIVSHDWSLLAAQVSVWSVAETKMVELPPAGSTLALLGLSVIRGSAEASWLTVKVWPTPPNGVTVMVAVRVLFVVFAAAVHCSAPDPIPVDPELIDSHASLPTAVHCSSGSSVKNETVPLLPSWPMLAEDGLMLRDPAAWLTTNVAADPCDGVIVMVAVRLAPFGFPATE
jgi:hypothetical protein